jgi:hypothetical protein
MKTENDGVTGRRAWTLGGVAVPALPEHPSGQDPASREGEEAGEGEDGGGRARKTGRGE